MIFRKAENGFLIILLNIVLLTGDHIEKSESTSEETSANEHSDKPKYKSQPKQKDKSKRKSRWPTSLS